MNDTPGTYNVHSTHFEELMAYNKTFGEPQVWKGPSVRFSKKADRCPVCRLGVQGFFEIPANELEAKEKAAAK